jgi:ribosome-associated translation inhibitor RaiA
MLIFGTLGIVVEGQQSKLHRLLINAKVNLRLEKLLSSFSEDLKIAQLKIGKNKIGEFEVNFDMNLPGKEHVFAATHHIKLTSALVDLEQQVEKQIKRYKQSLTNYSLS